MSHADAMMRNGGTFTFQLVVFRVRMEKHIREELFEAVPGVPRSVLHVRPHRLVQLHQELLRWRAQLLNHLVPLVNILGFSVRKRTEPGLCKAFHNWSVSVLGTFSHCYYSQTVLC